MANLLGFAYGRPPAGAGGSCGRWGILTAHDRNRIRDLMAVAMLVVCRILVLSSLWWQALRTSDVVFLLFATFFRDSLSDRAL